MNVNEEPSVETPEAFELRALRPYYGWRFDRLWNSTDEKIKRRKAHWQKCRDNAQDHCTIIEWHHGLKFHLYMGHDLSRQLYIAGCYEPNALYALDQLITPGMTVIDGGAHEGLFSLFCGQKIGEGGHLYAFEPSPRERDRLQKNIQLNELKHVHISDLALSDKKRRERLRIAEATHSGQNTLGRFVHDGVNEESTLEVQTISLDDFVAEQSVQSIDFIKIDAEGSEGRILRGASQSLKKFRPLLFLEYLPESLKNQGTDPESLLAQLRELDYQFYQFAHDGLLEAVDTISSEDLFAIPKEKVLPEALVSRPSFSIGAALYQQRDALHDVLNTVKTLRESLGQPESLQGYQWMQWFAMIRAYQPDFIVQLGRGEGQLTSAISLALSSLPQEQRGKFLSLGSSDEFQSKRLEALEDVIGQKDLAFLNCVTLDCVESYDFDDFLRESIRPLIVWQSYSPELANCLFGSILSKLHDRDHQVILHGLTDLRYHDGMDRSYLGRGFWCQSENRGAALTLGGTYSPDGKSLAYLDFCERNRLEAQSGDAALHEYFDGHQEQELELKRLLGDEYFQRDAHWYQLSLNDGPEDFHFPAFRRARHTAKNVAWSLNLDDAEEEKRGRLPTVTAALGRQRQLIAESRESYRSLIEGLNFDSIISKAQWAQILSYILDFEPDLIIELGRGHGASTVTLNYGTRLISGCELLSIDNSTHWDDSTLDRVISLVSEEWFSSLKVYSEVPGSSELEALLSGKKRVVIYLEMTSLSLMNWLFSTVLSKIKNLDHIVIAKNMTDSRYNTVDSSYGGGLWKIGQGAGTVQLGHLTSRSEQALAIVDFCSRNHLPLHSVDRELHETWNEGTEDLRQTKLTVGEDFFSLSGHWFYFSMREAPGDLTFPVLAGEAAGIEKDSGPFQCPSQGSTNHYELTVDSAIPSVAQALDNQWPVLAEHRGELLKLQDAVGHSTDLSFNQWNQLFAYTLEFKPDLIIELGRGRGNSTCLFTQAARTLGEENHCQVLSLCNSSDWDEETAPKLESVFGRDWFENLTAERCDILRYDPSPFIAKASRVMVFWDAHGFEIAEWMLGAVLPQLKDKEHAILMHDMTDSRYNSGQEPYRQRPLWMGNNWSGPRLRMGHIDSAVEQSIAIIDFSSRNHLPLFSADHSLHKDIGAQPGRQKFFEEKLGADAFSLYAHWFYFSLKDAQVPVNFPQYEWPADEVEEFSDSDSEPTNSGDSDALEVKKQGFIMKLKVAGGILLGRVPIDPWV